MVVVTVRLEPVKRNQLKMMWRQDPNFNSISHIIQTAVDDFLERRLAK